MNTVQTVQTRLVCSMDPSYILPRSRSTFQKIRSPPPKSEQAVLPRAFNLRMPLLADGHNYFTRLSGNTGSSGNAGSSGLLLPGYFVGDLMNFFSINTVTASIIANT